MAIWLVVLIVGVLWIASSQRKRSGRRPPSVFGWGGLLAVAIIAFLLLRFGMHWLVVAGGAVLAVARALLPFVRLWPLFRGAAGASRQGPAPGSAGGEGQSSSSGRAQRMTRQEALQVLGLDSSATPDDVRREYRRLMKKLHPDLGGSSYLAAKINEARDVLS